MALSQATNKPSKAVGQVPSTHYAHIRKNKLKTKEKSEDASSQYKVSIKIIGPAEAKAILQQGNKYNRPVSIKHVQKLATKMTNGNWMFNGVPLLMNGEQLLDGQHRLNAIIMSGKTYSFVVVEGVDPFAFRTIDTPKKRDFATALYIDGEDHPKDLAHAVSWLFHHSGSTTAEIEDKYDQLNEHPAIREIVAQFTELKTLLPKGLSVGFLSATKYLTAKLDAKLAEEFYKQVVTGEKTTDNTELLRETVTTIKEMETADKRHLINSAFRQTWNAERAGRKLEKIKLSLTLPEFK